MHFSKTYAQLLLTLPPDLRRNAIEYRQLKKLINAVVQELISLGLSPSLLQELLRHGPRADIDDGKQASAETTESERDGLLRAVYDLVGSGAGARSSFEPRLRLLVKSNADNRKYEDPVLSFCVTPDQLDLPFHHRLAQNSRAPPHSCFPDFPSGSQGVQPISSGCAAGGSQELVVPLTSDAAFFQLLSSTLDSISSQLLQVQSEFLQSLLDLSQAVSNSALPVSASSSFEPHSSLSDPSSISFPVVYPRILGLGIKSDLYSWREIFQLYVEAEIFESVGEASRGERSVSDSEQRLAEYAARLQGLGYRKKLKLKESQAALKTFLHLNIFILNLKKLQYANAEATRKILKKHNKRTALPLSMNFFEEASSSVCAPTSSRGSAAPLPRILVQAIGETLLPVIPHLEDYSCLICFNIAFKPIRLQCGHLFCVRCLVKMQKRGDGNCPMCRSPTVLTADRSNVDWALLNFMKDWFPVESRLKLKDSEREAAEEQLEELGLKSQGCIIT